MSRTARFFSLVMVILLTACAKPAASPTGAAPAAGAPAASDWSKITEAAKAEGRVVLMGQSGQPVSEALADAFQRAYPDITVDYTGLAGAQMVTKVLTEKAAGLHTTDVVVHGTTSVINGLLPEGALDPIMPALVGPDIDATKWRSGQFEFADESGQYALLFLAGLKIPLIYNPERIRPGEITSYHDLLAPRYKGQIAMLDPRVAGAGLASSIFFYTTPSLGQDYLQKLFTQDVVLTKDDRQLTDWVARGQYLIGLASNDFTALDLKSRGVPVESLPAEAVKEGTYMTGAWGSVALLSHAPHPNAARVYLNWLLSKEGQEGVAQASGYPSRRQDASTTGLRESVIPRPDVDYRDLSKQRYILQQDEIIAYMRALVPD